MHHNRATSLGPFPDAIHPYFDRAAYLAGAVWLTEVKTATIRWLWPGRIPLGRLTLLVSDPGVGKSLLTLDIAARISTGAPWPDQCSSHAPRAVTEPVARQGDKERGRQGETSSSSVSLSPCLPLSLSSSPTDPGQSRQSGSVLLLTAEDDLADTVRPRLEALGANCDRILAVPAVPGQDLNVSRTFALNRDLGRLANLVDSMPDCRLVIIDPISAYLGGANEHANSEVQTLLAPLSALARQRQFAVLAVSHLRKKDGAAIHRTMGSQAFVAAARTAWILSKDPADANRRFLLPLKNNIGADTTGLAYTLESSSTGHPPTIRWSPEPVNMTAETILAAARSAGRPGDERQHAINWLKRTLASGPQPTVEVKRTAEAHGISWGTLRRVFRELPCQAVRDGYNRRWLWKLDEQGAQNPEGEFCAPCDIRDETAKTPETLPEPFDIPNPAIRLPHTLASSTQFALNSDLNPDL